MIQLIERGTGIPLVLVPGVQGRWEYMARTIDALAQSFRVITFSLADEPVSGLAHEKAGGFDAYVSQIRLALNRAGVNRATICGVSFGGRIALRFAAEEPRRTACLVLASTPGPGWHLSSVHRRYVRSPRLFAPLFFAGIPVRLRKEVARALPAYGARLRLIVEQLQTLARAPVSPRRLATRAELIAREDVEADCARIVAPTLLITGEPALDHVVPVDGTSSYTRLIGGSRHVTLERTGHLGCITRPDAFATLIRDFVTQNWTNE